MRKLLLSLLSAGALFIGFALWPTRGAAQNGSDAIVGTWMETLTSSAGSFQTLATYGAGGILIDDASIDLLPAFLSGPTHGAWVHKGGHTFRSTNRAFSFNPTGVFVINLDVTLDPKGDSYTGTGSFVIVDNQGHVIFDGGSFTDVGTRLKVP